MDEDKINKIIGEHRTDKSELIPILQDIQAEYNWLPRDALRQRILSKRDLKKTRVRFLMYYM